MLKTIYRKHISSSWCSLLIRALIILIPCYAVAYISDKMVYVVPMVAATVMISAGLKDFFSPARQIQESTESSNQPSEHDTHDTHETTEVAE